MIKRFVVGRIYQTVSLIDFLGLTEDSRRRFQDEVEKVTPPIQKYLERVHARAEQGIEKGDSSTVALAVALVDVYGFAKDLDEELHAMRVEYIDRWMTEVFAIPSFVET